MGFAYPFSEVESKLTAAYFPGLWFLLKNVTKLAKKGVNEIPKVFINGKSHKLDVHYKLYPDRVSREIKKSVNSSIHKDHTQTFPPIPQLHNLAISQIPNSAFFTTPQLYNSAIKPIPISVGGALYWIMAAVILFLTAQSFQECQIFLVLNHTFLTPHLMFWDSHNSSLIPYQKQNQSLFCLLPAGKFDSLNT